MLEKLSVRTKIMFLSIVMIALICIIAGLGIYFNKSANDSLDEMYRSNLMATQFLNDANSHFRNIDVDVAYIMLGSSNLDKNVLYDDISDRLKAIKGDSDKLKEIIRGEKLQEVLSTLDSDVDAAISAVTSAKNLPDVPANRVQVYKSVMAVKSIANDLNAITPGNVFQGKVLFEKNNEQHEMTVKIFMANRFV